MPSFKPLVSTTDKTEERTFICHLSTKDDEQSHAYHIIFLWICYDHIFVTVSKVPPVVCFGCKFFCQMQRPHHLSCYALAEINHHINNYTLAMMTTRPEWEVTYSNNCLQCCNIHINYNAKNLQCAQPSYVRQ